MELNRETREEYAEFKDPYCAAGGGGEEDEEETLSFCDLPIYGDEAEKYWENYDSSSESSFSSFSSSSSSSDDFFEFSSPLKATEPETIMFCGKIIPYKKDPSLDQKKAQTFGTVGLPVEKNVVKAARKVRGSKLSLSSRWYLLVFGPLKFPGHMEMRDIKRRQNTRSSSSSPASCVSEKYDGVGGEIIKGDHQVKSKGIWALLRAIGCTSQSANSMVKASLGCVPKI